MYKEWIQDNEEIGTFISFRPNYFHKDEYSDERR